MRVSATRAPAEAQNRLDRARLALRLAEERTGLRDSAALTVQRALSSATTSALLSTSAESPQAGSSASPASPASPAALSACQDSGVLTLHGSTTLLLAALALRQGATGWCGIIGGDELGWCAATEVGLDLNRVLTVPAPLLDDASTLTVTSTLLDGVDTLARMVATRGDVEIMAGGGIRTEDIPAILATGVQAVHLSARGQAGLDAPAGPGGGTAGHDITDPALVVAAVTATRG